MKHLRAAVRPILFSLVALLLPAACKRAAPAAPADAGGGTGAKPPLKVVLQTDWFAQPEHGGFYQALVKGYYRDAGLDVEIRQGNPSTHPAQLVATGQADIAIGRSDDLIMLASRGVPLVMFGTYMQRDPQAIMFHLESGIKSFADLDGRNIMAVPGSAFLTMMENKYHIKVAVTPSDFGMSRFLADPNFVQQCFLTNEPYYVRREGAHVGVLPLSDTGFSPYRGWYARKSFLADHPDAARAFCAASLRGWREYLDGDRTAADARISALNPKMEPGFIAFSVQAMHDYHLIAGDPAAGEFLGAIDPARLTTEIAQLAAIGLLDRPVTVDEILDRRFLPAVDGTVPPATP